MRKGNIIFLIDNNGKVVVEYRCSAYKGILMEQNLFDDTWKKESKFISILMIIFFIAALVCPLVTYFQMAQEINFSIGEVLAAFFVPFLFGCLFLYFFLYAVRYKISVCNGQLTRRTLFGSKTWELSEISSYTYKKYSSISALYQIDMTVGDESIKIYTRYPDAFIEIIGKNHNNKIHT